MESKLEDESKNCSVELSGAKEISFCEDCMRAYEKGKEAGELQ